MHARTQLSGWSWTSSLVPLWQVGHEHGAVGGSTGVVRGPAVMVQEADVDCLIA